MAEQPPPTVLGERYRVLRELGRGGMGAVYLVSHMHTGERMALKVLHSHVFADPGAVSRFQREMRTPATVRSPHLVKVTDAGIAPELNGAPFMVMELLEGMDICRLLKRKPQLTLEEVVWVLGQAQGVLDKLHLAGLVHRDLKPENLFIHRREEGGLILKILDFGLVRLCETSIDVASGARLTQSGVILGTPLYASPEQVLGDNIGPQADIWALALITFEMLTGQTYWSPNNMTRLLLTVAQAKLAPPSERDSKLPPEFDAWFLRSCARDPAQRFPTVSTQVYALAEALKLEKLLSPGAPAPETLQRLLHAEPPVPAEATQPVAARDGAAGGKPMLSDGTQHTLSIKVQTPVALKAKLDVPNAQPPQPKPQRRQLARWLGPLLFLIMLGGIFSMLRTRGVIRQHQHSDPDRTPAQPQAAVPVLQPAAPAPPPTNARKHDSADAPETAQPSTETDSPRHRHHKRAKRLTDNAGSHSGERDLTQFDPAAP